MSNVDIAGHQQITIATISVQRNYFPITFCIEIILPTPSLLQHNQGFQILVFFQFCWWIMRQLVLFRHPLDRSLHP